MSKKAWIAGVQIIAPSSLASPAGKDVSGTG